MDPDPTVGLTDAELADLARLVDGTLPADRRADVEARVSASPQLGRIVERQRLALEVLHGTADTGAPARLRAHVDRRRGTGRAASGARRRAVLGGAIAAAAAVTLALILVLPGTTPGGPSVADTAVLAQKPPTRAAPGEVPGTPQLLRAEVDDVRFPNYSAKFGWKSVGARTDNASGRDATTVFYSKSGRTIAYTIVSGSALRPPADARLTTRDGVDYRTFRQGRRSAVTWERRGHTCVLSGESARPAELVALADWRGKGAVLF